MSIAHPVEYPVHAASLGCRHRNHIREHTYVFAAGNVDLPGRTTDYMVQKMDAFEAVNVGIAHQIGHYADAVRLPTGTDQVVTSGTPGRRADGTVPADFAEDATQAWPNVERSLNSAAGHHPGPSVTDRSGHDQRVQRGPQQVPPP
ncbi:hypothetical protein [Actinoplanes sp. NPDC051411]|uniref:hypothetical protein n=1 Tax=Actinoplanes sp. NPDC051411 TaxID=3155522 RepID=UPI00341A46B1